MPNFRGLLDKNKLILYLLIIISSFALFSVVHQEPRVSIQPVKVEKMTQLERLARDNQELRQRLSKLEPASPVKIVRSEKSVVSSDDLPVVDVIAEGTRVPFKKVYENLSWVRADYQPYWYSKPGNWSSVPDRIHSSYHRLFATVGTNGLWNETLYDSGILEAADKFTLPVFDDNPSNTIAVVTFQHHITDVVVFNNQVVLMGTPMRTGLQVIAIDKRDLFNSGSGEVMTRNSSQEYLFQLSTPDGYELDYNNIVINY